MHKGDRVKGPKYHLVHVVDFFIIVGLRQPMESAQAQLRLNVAAGIHVPLSVT